MGFPGCAASAVLACPTQRSQGRPPRPCPGTDPCSEVRHISNDKANPVQRSNPDGGAVDRNGDADILAVVLDRLIVIAEFCDPIYPVSSASARSTEAATSVLTS